MGELRYHDQVPIRWQVLTEPLAEAELDRYARDNERLLRQLAGLEASLESGEEDGPAPRYLQVLELRLQLMAELLAEVLAQTRPLPPRRSIWLSGAALEWIAPQPPQAGADLLVELFLHEALPRPLRLPARVTQVDAQGERSRVQTTLQSLGDGVVEQLEKLVFRQHRRMVASRRGRSV